MATQCLNRHHMTKIEMWHGHPDLYINKLEESLDTLDDSDLEFFQKLI